MEENFGLDLSGRQIHKWTLENEHFSVSVTDYGAALVSYIDKKKNTDIVAGFDSAEEYTHQTAHFGAMIGRVANRIKDARFTLNGKTYELEANSGKNSLHGGFRGFDKTLFHGEESENKVIFTAESTDGDEGYPGNLKIRITYTLLENGVRIDCEGLSDADTLLGITNHSYFNLNGDGPIDHHLVTIHASNYAPNDETGVSEAETKPCEGSPFDFRTEKEIGADFNSDDEQIRTTGGYDHHYAVDGSGLREMAVCRANGLKLITRSNLPGVHFYTGNFLKGNYTGKYGVTYKRHERVCFEPEYYPNAINYEGHEKPVLKAGTKAVQTIEYLLEEEDA
jgi:aldose 1-epimerase